MTCVRACARALRTAAATLIACLAVSGCAAQSETTQHSAGLSISANNARGIAPSRPAETPPAVHAALTPRDAIIAAIQPCMDVEFSASRTRRAEIQVELAPDGTVQSASIVSVTGQESEAANKVFAERSRRAVLNPACNKLPIPPDKYEELKTLVLTFDELEP